MLFKVMGIILAAAAPALWGFRKSGALSTRTREIDGLLLLVSGLSQGIAYLKAPLKELIERTTGTDAAQRYSVLRSLRECLPHAPSPELAWAAADKSRLIPDDLAVMDEFFTALGKTDAIGQSDICAAAQARLRHCREDAERGQAQKGKLYRSLGMLTGAFIAIILI